jgi:TusE/DsrC/DsvC family sulfur relay protein
MNPILNEIIFDREGFMVDAEAWSPEIGKAIAEDLHIELKDSHWQVINFARQDFTVMGEAPSLRRITDLSEFRTKDLFEMFAGNPSKKVAKIAGLPKPPGCI